MTENVQNKLALLESKRLSLLDTCTWFMEVKENKDGIQLIVQKKIIDENLLLNNVNLTENFENETKGNSKSNSQNQGTSNNKNLL